MTVNHRASTPLALPIGSLLPPRDDAKPAGPAESLPFPYAALLGPLPPTSPLHLALGYLTLADLPDYHTAGHSTPMSDHEAAEAAIPRAPARALLVNCSSTWTGDIEEEDEDWLRDHGAEYGIMEQLSRVDIRFCPSPKHLLLLLTLLTTSGTTISVSDGPHELTSTPGLIVLYDIAGLLMRLKETDENLPPGLDENDDPKETASEMEFEPGTTISDYLNLIAAAKATLHHFAATTDYVMPQLIILEPHLSSSSYLSILKPAAAQAQKGTLATPVREKKVNVKEALEQVVGQKAIGMVELGAPDPDPGLEDPNFYSLTFSDEEMSYRMVKRRCERSPWARAAPTVEEGEETQEDPGGWRWEWV